MRHDLMDQLTVEEKYRCLLGKFVDKKGHAIAELRLLCHDVQNSPSVVLLLLIKFWILPHHPATQDPALLKLLWTGLREYLVEQGPTVSALSIEILPDLQRLPADKFLHIDLSEFEGVVKLL
jgi:hypothetical protein